MCVAGMTNLWGQCPLLPSLVSGLDTNTIGVSALSVQRSLKNYHPRHRVDGEESTDWIHQRIDHRTVKTWRERKTNSYHTKMFLFLFLVIVFFITWYYMISWTSLQDECLVTQWLEPAVSVCRKLSVLTITLAWLHIQTITASHHSSLPSSGSLACSRVSNALGAAFSNTLAR